jgi:hypothetical protein
MPILAGLAQETPAFQFNLAALFGFVALTALLFSCAKGFGLVPTAGIVLVSAAWGLGAGLFRQSFVNATVIGGAVALFAALTTTSLHHARNESRRTLGTDNLRRLGGAYLSANDYRSFEAGSASFVRSPTTPSPSPSQLEALIEKRRFDAETLNQDAR